MKTPREAFRRIAARSPVRFKALRGQPWITDFVVDLPASKAEELVGLLAPDFYAGLDRTYKFDFFPLKTDEYSRIEFGRRQFVAARLFGDEPLEYAVATAEDTILRKLLWYRAGGEISERQWNNMRGVVRQNIGKLDMDYLQKWAVRLKVDLLLDRLFKE